MLNRSSESFQLVLNGGLGNQLFGYAAGRSIEASTGLVCEFIAPDKFDRNFELDNFGITCTHKLLNTKNPFNRSIANRVINRMFPSVFRYSETSFRFDNRFYKNPQGKTLRGYFQSYLYLQGVESELLNLPTKHVEFSDQFNDLQNKWGNSNYIAVHIRRGDYLGKENYHGLASKEFFNQARNRILELNPNSKFVVFSDSIEIAKADFPHGEIYISANDLPKPTENLILMSRMGGLIGSNSSLSWWAGFLNQKPEMNFFPHPWFANQTLDTRDLLPPHWNRLDSGI